MGSNYSLQDIPNSEINQIPSSFFNIEYGYIQLFVSAAHHHKFIQEFLFSFGGKFLTLYCENNCSAFFPAIEDNNIKIVLFLLSNGSNPSLPSNVHSTPIHHSAMYNNKDICKLLLKHENVNILNSLTALSPFNNDIKHYLDNNNGIVDINVLNKYHFTPFMTVIDSTPFIISNNEKKVDVVKCSHYQHYLLQNMFDDDGSVEVAPVVCPLSCSKDHTEEKEIEIENKILMLEFLLDNGADPFIPNKWKETPLIRSIVFSEFPIITFLSNLGAINIPDEDGMTPLHYACMCSSFELCKLLLNKGANIEALNNSGQKPIELSNNKEIKQLFLELKYPDSI